MEKTATLTKPKRRVIRIDLGDPEAKKFWPHDRESDRNLGKERGRSEADAVLYIARRVVGVIEREKGVIDYKLAIAIADDLITGRRAHMEYLKNLNEIITQERYDEGGRIAVEILEERVRTGKRPLTRGGLAVRTHKEWKARSEKQLTEFLPLSPSRIQRKILAPKNLPPKMR